MSTSWFVSCCDCGVDSDWAIHKGTYKEIWNAVKLKKHFKAIMNCPEYWDIAIAGSMDIGDFIGEHGDHELCVTSEYGDVITSDEDLEAYENG